MQKNKRPRSGASFYLILIAVILLSSLFMNRMTPPNDRMLSSMEQDIEDGKVESVIINGYEMQIIMKTQSPNVAPVTYSKTVSPVMIEEYHKILQKAVQEGKIESFDYKQPADFA